ncbi:MAG: pentapeptide repeat-containing protein [Planctomycetes bacterium]|nr:pentapeptide repeat-containing protein [Planctomycetota bacterium]
MTRSELSRRWSDSSFVEGSSALLNEVFVEKTAVVNADLRGIIVGLDGAMPALLHSDFQDVDVRELDASFGEFSCSFVRGVFRDCRFDGVKFDTCRFKDAKFYGCSLERARLESPVLDDAEFVDCLLPGAAIRGRGCNEYGGRRVRFERCRFQGSRFQNLQLRGTRFIDCVFDGAGFKKCLLAGVTITGSGLTREQLEDCEISQTTIDGAPL